MTNINREAINSKDYKLAEKHLINLIATLNKKTSHYLISGLLSEAEQIMIIKRFAAVFMFNRGYTTYRVCKTVSISPSSSHRLYLQYEEGRYDNLLSCIKKKESSVFLQVISDLIMAQVDMKARARLANRSY
jgi:hypothetical protein